MKTLICTRLIEGEYRVAIVHRAKEALAGGTVAAWLMQNGRFEMPTSEEGALKIQSFKSARQAQRRAEQAFSVLRFAVELDTILWSKAVMETA